MTNVHVVCVCAVGKYTSIYINRSFYWIGQQRVAYHPPHQFQFIYNIVCGWSVLFVNVPYERQYIVIYQQFILTKKKTCSVYMCRRPFTNHIPAQHAVVYQSNEKWGWTKLVWHNTFYLLFAVCEPVGQMKRIIHQTHFVLLSYGKNEEKNKRFANYI